MAVMHGRDDREKIKEALFWLESGTAKNCPHAMALLGSYYLDGGFTERSRREAERDPEKGMALLRCARGSYRAWPNIFQRRLRCGA